MRRHSQVPVEVRESAPITTPPSKLAAMMVVPMDTGCDKKSCCAMPPGSIVDASVGWAVAEPAAALQVLGPHSCSLPGGRRAELQCLQGRGGQAWRN